MKPVTQPKTASLPASRAFEQTSARHPANEQPGFSVSTDFVFQSSLNNPLQHLAIIMDGNRRWAAQRGLTASAGHRAGAEALKVIIEAVSETRILTLSVFGFSQLNWRRPTLEVRWLFDLIAQEITAMVDTCRERELRVEFIGRRDRLPNALVERMTTIEASTNRFLRCLRIAIDYSGRSAIATAATGTSCVDQGLEGFEEQLRVSQQTQAIAATSVDLLIRTGGEQRLSDFLLWESAFAELRFEDCYWPDFSPARLQRALSDFEKRQRRFGR